jgi:tetratricopeptide (TPR) repeat protein
MKRIAPIILVAAVVLVAVGLFLAKRDPVTAHTQNQAAWEAYMEGEFALASFRYTDAAAKLQEALALDPELAVAHAALSELYGRMGKGDLFKEHIAIADSLADRIADDEAKLLLKVRLSNAGPSKFHSQQDSLLAAAEQVAPNDLTVLLTRTLRAADAEDLATVEEIYNHILEINPNYAAAYNFLGYLYLNQGRYEDAETAMRRYAFVAPDLANPHDSLGEVLMTIGRYEEAEVEFRTALAKQPDFFYSLINIGGIYIARGEVDRALTLFDRVRGEVVDTSWEQHLDNRLLDGLFVHRLADDFDHYAGEYIAKHPDRERIPYLRMRRLLLNGRATAAISVLDSLMADVHTQEWYETKQDARRSIDINELRTRGLAAESLGNYGEAARFFKEALDLEVNLPPHYSLFDRIHLAYNLIPLRAYDEARIHIRDALSINPRIAEGILVAANIEAAAGQTTEALRLLDTVERILERADQDFPALRDAQQLREQLPDPDRI